MPGLADVLEELVVAALMKERESAPRRSGAAWLLMGASVLLSAIGALLLLYALDRFFESLYSPDLAAAITAACVFAIAGSMALSARLFCRRPVSRHGDARGAVGQDIHRLIADVLAELEDPIRDNPKTAVLLAALAGFVATPPR